MTHQPIFFPTLARGSSYNTKRKTYDDSDDETPQPLRVRSPPLKRRATFPAPQALQMPELMTDCSNSASNSDEDMGMDQDGDMDMDAPDHGDEEDDRGFVPRYDYEYGMSGSGGMGFGPGAEEDGEFMEETMSGNKSSTYPSLTAHTNPNHFSNNPPYTSNTLLPFNNPNAGIRASSPLSAQPFATTLRAPSGLMQPAQAAPVSFNASEVEKARSAHGPNCKSIPKLVISPHPDAVGKQAMYTMCPDCGSCERAA